MTTLKKYEEFKIAVNCLIGETSTLKEFSTRLKEDPELSIFRRNAREELQSIYNLIQRYFDLPALPVYLPVRKKIVVQGRAFNAWGTPTEVRLYPIRGCQTKPYEAWTPADLTCLSQLEIFETLVHEIAHVLEAHRNGSMGHEKPFVDAYEAIEAFLKSQGFLELFSPALRLMGVPMGSYAAWVSSTSDRKQ